MPSFKYSKMLMAGALALIALPALAASSPSISLISIKNGEKITSNNIPVSVAVSGFNVECNNVGKPGSPGAGHIHAMLDGMSMAQMTNFYCANRFEISGAGLKPGTHVLAVVLADDAHVMVGQPAMVKFDYQPAQVQQLPASDKDSHPSLKIISPAEGATVGKRFDLQVAVQDFTLSCDAEGKPDEPGIGHLHVFVTQKGVTDAKSMGMNHGMAQTGSKMGGHMSGNKMSAMEGGMMSMAGMVGMPCTKTIPVDLSTWRSGKAKVAIILANNDHMPTMGANGAAVTLNVR